MADTDPNEKPPITKEEAHRIGYQRILDLVAWGGKVTKHFRCQSCGQDNKVEVPVLDADEHVRMMKYLDDSKKNETDDISKRVNEFIGELDEMSDEELTELLLALRA